MSKTNEVRTRRFFCNDCGRQTWHALVWGDSKHFDAAEYDGSTVEFADRWLEVWQCQGCEDPFLMVAWMTSEDPERDETFYPPRAVHHIRPKKFRKMPLYLAYVYEESVRAFNSNSPLLCVAGLRALLEGICNHRGMRLPDRKTLKQKIDSLKSVVPIAIRDNLHGFRFLGNQALHRLAVPDSRDVALAVTLMEESMNLIYELEPKSALLLARTKARISTEPSS